MVSLYTNALTVRGCSLNRGMPSPVGEVVRVLQSLHPRRNPQSMKDRSWWENSPGSLRLVGQSVLKWVPHGFSLGALQVRLQSYPPVT